ncbi:MAG TPA: hypothetical protein VGS79_07605 [Puia sp.]|nr:hypothetical protein [Puia sp.]
MPNSQFHTAISAPRFNRYLAACNENRRRAEKLYRVNLRLSQKIYAVNGLFEVILRNSIDRHFIRVKGPFWLEESVMPDGYLDTSAGCEDSFHAVQEAIHKLGPEYTHDGLIAKLTFGFWAYQFSKKEFAASGSTLLQIFPNRPHGVRQKDVFKNLIRINDTRNRIAHYEPICFDKSTGAISAFAIQRRYDLIIEMLHWLGCNPKRILYGVDTVQNSIRDLDGI